MAYSPVFRIICFLAVLRLRGQQVNIAPRLRVDTSLVLVPLTATDELGRPVLGREKVLDNGVAQIILQIAMDDPVADENAEFFLVEFRSAGRYRLPDHDDQVEGRDGVVRRRLNGRQ